jgi:hypothetical protein
MVTVLVGPEEDEFEVHYRTLDLHSARFRVLLAGKRSDQAHVVKLPEISTTYFEMYWHWLYTGELNGNALDYVDGTPYFLNRQLYDDNHEFMRGHLLQNEALKDSSLLADRLIRFWVYADLLGDNECQDKILDELVEWFLDEDIPTAISPATIAFVDENTEPGCPMRQFCIDWIDTESARAESKESKRDCLSEKAPKWLLLGLLSTKMCREEGVWEGQDFEDPRVSCKEGRYSVLFPH